MAGLLFQNDLEIQRYYFNEALDYYGISAQYYQVKDADQHYTVAGEISSYFYDPTNIRVIFDQVPKISTLKKLGWVTELNQDSQPIIHIPFDTPGIQVGAVFKIQDPLNPTSGKLFRATKMSASGIIYPTAVTLQIVAIAGEDPEETTSPYEGNDTLYIDKVEDLTDVY